MKNKVFRRMIPVVLLALALAACTGEKDTDAPKDTTASTVDWRNRIAYEGSFNISDTKKLLYALDKGSITLWDNAGNGEILQTLSYETEVADAMEQIKQQDVNGDGFIDLLIPYSNEEGNRSDSLFLWRDEENRFVPCSVYRQIKNPEFSSELGTVTSSQNQGAFGKLNRTYQFTNSYTLELVASEVSDAAEIAERIAESLAGSAQVREAQGHATIAEEVCTTYIVGADSAGGSDLAYIAHSADADWYVDIGCKGQYRHVIWEDEAYQVGDYLGETGEAMALANMLSEEALTLEGQISGSFGEWSATRFAIYTNSGFFCYLCRTETGLWFYGTETSEYYVIYPNQDGAIGERSENSFH